MLKPPEAQILLRWGRIHPCRGPVGMRLNRWKAQQLATLRFRPTYLLSPSKQKVSICTHIDSQCVVMGTTYPCFLFGQQGKMKELICPGDGTKHVRVSIAIYKSNNLLVALCTLHHHRCKTSTNKSNNILIEPSVHHPNHIPSSTNNSYSSAEVRPPQVVTPMQIAPTQHWKC